MINLREIEHEFHPDGGNLGRGRLISKAELDALDTTGYTPFTITGTIGEQVEFPVYSACGSPSATKWRGFIREENGVHYCAAVEYYNV